MHGLILTRYPGESFLIGSNVKVTILGWRGGQVRINIEAPPEISVDREDIRESKMQEPGFQPGEVK